MGERSSRTIDAYVRQTGMGTILAPSIFIVPQSGIIGAACTTILNSVLPIAITWFVPGRCLGMGIELARTPKVLCERGRQRVLEKFDYRIVAARVEETYAQALGG